MNHSLRSLWYPVTLFGVLFALLLTWNMATPLFASPDEPAHLYKAYGTAHGEMLGTPIPDQPSNIRLFDVPDTMGQPNVMCYFFVPEQPADCATGSSSAGVSAAAVYPPFWYAIVGGGARVIDSDGQRVYRAVAAALCAALIAAAFAFARRSSAARLSPLLLLALPPMTLFLAGTVNPNGFEVAAFLLLWTLCLHISHRRATSWQSGMLVGLLLATVLLSRFASLIWVAGGVVVVIALVGWNGARRFLTTRFLLPAVGSTVAAVVALFVWSVYAGAEATDERIASDWTRSHVFTYTVKRLPEYARQMIGVLGWLDTRMPLVTYGAFATITIVAVAGVITSRNRRLQLATAAVFVGLLTAPVLLNMVSARKAGLIWQGRYALPLFAGLGVLGMIGWHETSERGATRLVPTVRLGVALLFVVAEVAGFWQTLRRFTVGSSGKIWLDGPLAWNPPLAPLLLIAINAVVVTAFVAVVLVGTANPSLDQAFDVPGTGRIESVIVGQRSAGRRAPGGT
ncbi:MAG: DUF2142 domain-containing protein [Actinomycetota bacterium]